MKSNLLGLFGIDLGSVMPDVMMNAVNDDNASSQNLD